MSRGFNQFLDWFGEQASKVTEPIGEAFGWAVETLLVDPVVWAGDRLAQFGGWIVEGIKDALGIEDPPDGTLITFSGGVRGLPIIYGSARTGGHLVFETTTGGENEFLHQVIVLGEGPIQSVTQIYIDDVPITDSRWNGLVRYTVHDGTDTQTADPDLVAEVPEWTTDHVGKGVAYVYLRFKWDKDKFRGRPRVQFDVAGRAVYDPRDGQTKFTGNPALILRDYLTSTRYGLGIDPADIDDTSIAAAADYCETQRVPYAGATARNLWEIGGVISTDWAPRDILNIILKSFRGFLLNSGGKWRVVVDKDEPAALALDEKSIVGRMTISKGGKREVLNRVEVTYVNPTKDHKSDVAVVDDATARASEDNGVVLSTRIDARLVRDVYRARDLGLLHLRQSRQSITVGLTATMDAVDLTPGDIVSISHPTPGWVDKPFRVLAMTLRTDGLISLMLREHDPGIYALDQTDYAPLVADVGLPDPTTVRKPSNVTGTATDAEAVLTNEGNRVYRILATWTSPADAYVIGYDVEVRHGATGAWTSAGSTHSKTDTSIYVSPVIDGETYYVRVRSRNAAGITSAWVESAAITVLGKAGPPSPITQLQVNAVAAGVDVVVPAAGMPLDPDLAAVEIWWHTVNDRTQVPSDTGNRIVVTARPGQSARTHVASKAGQTIYAWARAIDTAGNASTWWPADNSGASGAALFTDATDVKYSDGTPIDDLQPREAGADNTGNRIYGTGGLLPNWNLDIIDGEGKPAGIQPVESVSDRNGIAATAEGLKIQHPSDDFVAYGFPAIPIDDKQRYRVVVTHRSGQATTTGLFLRFNELNAALNQGKTHIGTDTGGSTVQIRSGWKDLIASGPMPGPTWVADEYIYTPTPGTKFASFSMYHWGNATSFEYEVDRVQIIPIAKTASDIDYSDGTNVDALKPRDPAATAGATWDDDISNQPSDQLIRNNQMDLSVWAEADPISSTIFVPDGSAWYLNGVSGENRIIKDVGPHGATELVWEGVASGDRNADGGWNYYHKLNNASYSIRKDVAYRFSVWIKRLDTQDGSSYLGTTTSWGNGDSAAAVTNTAGTDNTNPYFWSGDLPELNKWYLVVGYLHPVGYTGGQTGLSGVWDPETGKRVKAGNDFVMKSNISRLMHRSYYYYSSTAGARQQFARPRIDIVDGSEPSIIELLGAADNTRGAIESTVTINDQGAIQNASWDTGTKKIKIDFANQRIAIGDDVYGSSTPHVLQEYNGGNPRFELTAGGERFFRMDAQAGVMELGRDISIDGVDKFNNETLYHSLHFDHIPGAWIRQLANYQTITPTSENGRLRAEFTNVVDQWIYTQIERASRINTLGGTLKISTGVIAGSDNFEAYFYPLRMRAYSGTAQFLVMIGQIHDPDTTASLLPLWGFGLRIDPNGSVWGVAANARDVRYTTAQSIGNATYSDMFIAIKKVGSTVYFASNPNYSYAETITGTFDFLTIPQLLTIAGRPPVGASSTDVLELGGFKIVIK